MLSINIYTDVNICIKMGKYLTDKPKKILKSYKTKHTCKLPNAIITIKTANTRDITFRSNITNDILEQIKSNDNTNKYYQIVSMIEKQINSNNLYVKTIGDNGNFRVDSKENLTTKIFEMNNSNLIYIHAGCDGYYNEPRDFNNKDTQIILPESFVLIWQNTDFKIKSEFEYEYETNYDLVDFDDNYYMAIINNFIMDYDFVDNIKKSSSIKFYKASTLDLIINYGMSKYIYEQYIYDTNLLYSSSITKIYESNFKNPIYKYNIRDKQLRTNTTKEFQKYFSNLMKIEEDNLQENSDKKYKRMLSIIQNKINEKNCFSIITINNNVEPYVDYREDLPDDFFNIDKIEIIYVHEGCYGQYSEPTDYSDKFNENRFIKPDNFVILWKEPDGYYVLVILNIFKFVSHDTTQNMNNIVYYRSLEYEDIIEHTMSNYIYEQYISETTVNAIFLDNDDITGVSSISDILIKTNNFYKE